MEKIKNKYGVEISRICASCHLSLSSTAVDANGVYRLCLVPGIDGKRPKVLPSQTCVKWTMATPYKQLKAPGKSLVKRKEYLDFVLYANTNELAPKELKIQPNEKETDYILRLRAYWEAKNKKSIYLSK